MGISRPLTQSRDAELRRVISSQATSNEPSKTPRDICGFALLVASLLDPVQGNWDTEEKPIFPEDEMNARLMEKRKAGRSAKHVGV